MSENVLLWSGGFDSTAILLHMYDHPEEYPCVRVMSCKCDDIPNHVEDSEGRAKIINLLKLNENPRFYLRESTMSPATFGGSQAILWTLLASMSLAENEDGKIHCGYIKGDDFWHFRPWFENAITNACKIVGSTVSFVYPHEWHTKKEMVKEYLGHKDVFESISWGGDTKTTKLKEREELEFLFGELNYIDCQYKELALSKECRPIEQYDPQMELMLDEVYPQPVT
jgi:hypothetical protein